MLKVEIDAHSGFCGGVIRAISKAESFLNQNGRKLYSLGDIVHNEEELFRLKQQGLISINNLDNELLVKNTPILIRAHGEPPCIYNKINELGLELIDCTCPVVLNLQKNIREAYSRVKQKSGSVILYGKAGHPEVLGLVGQVQGDVLVVSSLDQICSLLDSNSIRLDRDIELFSQTTMSPLGYSAVAELLQSKMQGAKLYKHDTICKQVASRYQELSDFAISHDVIIFVAGRHSSNGQVLSNLCKNVNPRTYLVGSENDFDKAWFANCSTVGVCGATSTPSWLLEKLAKYICINY